MTTMAEQVEREQAEHEDKLRSEAEPENDDDSLEPDEEAAEGEPAEPGEPDPDDPDAPAEPEPAELLAAIGPETLEKAERKRANYRKGMAELLGEAYVAHECIFCTGLGYTPDPPPVGAVFTVVESEAGLGFDFELPGAEGNLKMALDKGPCEECGAEGFVLTGSKNPNARTAACGRCNGNGWVVVARPPEAPAVPAGYAPSPPVNPAVAAGQNLEDGWGRPFGHKHYGVPPAMIEA